MSTLTIDVPLLSRRQLERIADAGARFELALGDRRRELGRAPLWIPYWPTRVGQVVTSSEPTTLDVDGRWHVHTWSIYAAGERLLRKRFPGPPLDLRRGDQLELTVTLRA